MDEDPPAQEPEPIEDATAEVPAEVPVEPQAKPTLVQRVPWKKVVIAAVIVPLIAGGYYLFKPERHKVHGVIAVIDNVYQFHQEGSVCVGEGGFDDMSGGTQVVVKDQDEHVIATSDLDKGLTIHDPNSCAFTFTVVVPGAKFYNFEIGHRSPVSYSKADMAKNKWSLLLSLGS